MPALVHFLLAALLSCSIHAAAPPPKDYTPPVVNYGALHMLSGKKEAPPYKHNADAALKAVLSMGVDPREDWGVGLNAVGDGLDQDDVMRDHYRRKGNGLFYLSNCGWLCNLDLEEVARVRALVFSDETRGDKDSAEEDGRGFIPAGGEAGIHTYYESKEGFSYGTSGNKFPAALPPGDIEFLERVLAESKIVSRLLMVDVFLPYLNSKIGKINEDGEKTGNKGVVALTAEDVINGEDNGLMRLFNYLPCDANAKATKAATDKQVLGSSPHKDWGLLTLILQSNSPSSLFYYGNYSSGVLNGADVDTKPQDVWHPVPYKRGTVLVNAGDFLELVSKINHEEGERGTFPSENQGTVKSPLHRVDHCEWSKGGEGAAESEGLEGSEGGLTGRWSFVFFQYPDFSMDVTALLGFVDSEKENLKEYNTLAKGSVDGIRTFGEWIERKWKSVSTQEVAGGGDTGSGDADVNTEIEIGVDGSATLAA